MNVIRIAGGLGNQLFQYAFGKVMETNGLSVIYNINWYDKEEVKKAQRTYVLDKFQVNAVTVTDSRGKKTIRENGYDSTLLKRDGFNFSGYWQYPAYYDGILSILRKEFCVKPEFYTTEFLNLKKEIENNPNAIAVHVRRGDYLQLANFPVMPIEYYNKALEKVKGDIYVFSDDRGWCADNFKNCKFVHLNDYLDFELMKLCKHQIISRSSFSWWAAQLNTNPSKVIVVPKQQIVRKGLKEKRSEFDPKEWIQL